MASFVGGFCWRLLQEVLQETFGEGFCRRVLLEAFAG